VVGIGSKFSKYYFTLSSAAEFPAIDSTAEAANTFSTVSSSEQRRIKIYLLINMINENLRCEVK
jgi:hypothetical protein